MHAYNLTRTLTESAGRGAGGQADTRAGHCPRRPGTCDIYSIS